jgi:hypothetical protein
MSTIEAQVAVLAKDFLNLQKEFMALQKSYNKLTEKVKKLQVEQAELTTATAEDKAKKSNTREKGAREAGHKTPYIWFQYYLKSEMTDLLELFVTKGWLTSDQSKDITAESKEKGALTKNGKLTGGIVSNAWGRVDKTHKEGEIKVFIADMFKISPAENTKLSVYLKNVPADELTKKTPKSKSTKNIATLKDDDEDGEDSE